MEHLYYPQTIINEPLGLFEAKGSKFLCYIFPLALSANTQAGEDTQSLQNIQKNTIIKRLQEEHKKAVHFVYAFRFFNQYHHIVEGSNDDGEPKGSSGAPILEVMRGEKLINSLCVCVRYFGGTKLGVGGLVRAYTQATLQATTNAKQKNILTIYHKTLVITITEKSMEYNKILYLAQKHHISIIQKTFIQADMSLDLQGKEEDIQSFLQHYKNS